MPDGSAVAPTGAGMSLEQGGKAGGGLRPGSTNSPFVPEPMYCSPTSRRPDPSGRGTSGARVLSIEIRGCQVFTSVTAAAFILLAPRVAWYVNLPLLLVLAVCFVADTASKKRHVRYLAFAYLVIYDVAAPYETSRKDGWNWVAWIDLVLLLAATLVALLALPGQEKAGTTRPAPLPTVRNRPVPAPRRRPARVAALRRQAQRAASRRR